MLRGDELGALLAMHLVRRAAAAGTSLTGVFAASIVSSSLLGRIAAAHGLGYAETLTGFKWISRVDGLRFGYEEAIGYCVDPDSVRDKDGVSAALLVAELAATLKAEGRTLLDLLDDIAREHGLHATDQLSARFDDLAQIDAAMARLRDQPPTILGGRAVTSIDDLAKGDGGLPPTDGLRYHLEGNGRVIVRPSGTEPKVKCYLEVVEPVPDGDVATARRTAPRAIAAIKATSPPRPASHVTGPSGLIMTDLRGSGPRILHDHGGEGTRTLRGLHSRGDYDRSPAGRTDSRDRRHRRLGRVPAPVPARPPGRRPGRRRGPRRDAVDPVDQDHRQGLGDRPGDLDDRPHDARGPGHAGQGPRALREGAAPRPGRPDRARASPPSASTPTWCRSPPTSWPAAACASRSVATAFPSGRAALDVKLADTRHAVDDGADEIDMVIDRGAFLSGRYREVFDEIVAVKQACGAAHLKVILETGELVTYDNVRRASWLAMLAGGGLHQDLDRQDLTRRDAAGDAGDARGGARLPGRDGPAGRRQAGRRHPHDEGRREVSRARQRDGRRRLARSRLVPPRRIEPAQRPADAAHEADHRPLQRSRLLHVWTEAERVDDHKKFEYAPAPESRAIVDLQPSYGLFINGEFVDPVDGHSFKTISPATEEVLAEVSEAGPTDVDRAVQAARRAYDRVWSKMPPRERGKYLYRIARILQERARELAVLESLDNGKPIRESRDVDIPLVAAWFFYYAGWADKLDHAGFGPDPKPLGVAGQVIPWNFPLLMLAWKIAPALAARQHRRAQAGRDDTAHRAAVRRDLPAGRPPAGRGQHRDRRGRDRPHAGRARRRQQGRVHRLDRRRQDDRALDGRHEEEGHPRARRQGGQHRLRRRTGRPGRRGHRQRDLLQPGPRVLRRVAAARAGERPRRGARRR